MRDMVGPADAGAEPVDAAFDIGCEFDADRRHPVVAGVSHDAPPAR